MRWRGDGWLKGTRWVPSPNQGERPAGSAVSLIVLHNISLPPDDFAGNWVERFFLNRLDPQAHPYFSTIAGLQVSAHFLIRRDGRVIQFVGCDRRAWHAGQSTWQGRENCNDYSVGIELEGSDSQPFTAAQYAALWPLIRDSPGALSDCRAGRPLPCGARSQDRPRAVFRLGRRSRPLSRSRVTG